MKNTSKKPGKGQSAIELFSTEGGIRAVNSPVRVKILSMLKEREMSFDDIVEASGKVKSTISVHLKTLVDEGIVGSRQDANDARKKIFFINSNYLGGLSKRQKLEEDMNEYISMYASGSADPFQFFRLMFRTIRVALINEGIDIDPVLHEAGMKVGEALYSKLEDQDMGRFLSNLATFWETQKLGTIEVKSFDPIVVIVTDCFECQDLPQLGRPACAFDAGVFKTVFTSHYKHPVSVKETNCYSMGDSYCRFVIDKV